MNLDKEEVLILIQEYQRHRILWDTRDKSYFNKNKKQDAWAEIGEVLKVDVEDAKRKISSLLGSFRREKSKGKRIIEIGNGTKEIYKSDWFAFKSFAFLMDKDEPRSTTSSEQIKMELVEFTDGEDVDQSSCYNYPIEQYSETSITESTESSRENFGKYPSPKRKRARNMEYNESPRSQEFFEHSQQTREHKDPTSTFSIYLAQKLNQFDPRTKSILIHEINELIFEAEMNMYSNHSSSAAMQSPSFSTSPTTYGVVNLPPSEESKSLYISP